MHAALWEGSGQSKQTMKNSLPQRCMKNSIREKLDLNAEERCHMNSGSLCFYLELHQVSIHVSAVAVLSHRVCELRNSVTGRSQPCFDLREVKDDLPVSNSVEGRRFL